MKFPRLVYKSASVYLLVEDAKQYDAAIAGDWFDNVPDALAGNKPNNSAPSRQELEAKAIELGLKFDGRTTDAKLGKLIAESLEK